MSEFSPNLESSDATKENNFPWMASQVMSFFAENVVMSYEYKTSLMLVENYPITNPPSKVLTECNVILFRRISYLGTLCLLVILILVIYLRKTRWL